MYQTFTRSIKRRVKYSFTLLEVMVGCSLLLLAMSVGGWQIHRLVEKKRFESETALLEDRISTCRYLALTTQSDWKGVLQKENNHWVFFAYSNEPLKTKSLKKVIFTSFSIKGSIHRYEFDFSSTGVIDPKPTLSLVGKHAQKELHLRS